jgi:HK97 gp10 family phage protein
MTEGRIGNKAKAGDGIGQPEPTEGFTVVTGTNVKYGPYVEFGTSRQSAQPYLYPAFFSLEPEVEREVAKVMQEDERLA